MPGISPGQAQADMDAINEGIIKAYPEPWFGERHQVYSAEGSRHRYEINWSGYRASFRFRLSAQTVDATLA
jgi:hypothetical protein